MRPPPYVRCSPNTEHLKLLRDAGVTRTRAEGMRCFVSLRREDLDHRFPGLLDAVLETADVRSSAASSSVGVSHGRP
jgi:hypothetical protein